jgi:two-component sensor histidine kinase
VANAWKYGALSRSEGVVHLTWSAASEGGGTVLHLTWHEENGTGSSANSLRFGSRQIKYSAEHGLSSTVELNTSRRV